MAALGAEEVAAQRVLDLGCGPGALVALLAERGATAVGIDLVEAHVAEARAGLEALGLEAEVMVGDAERLPLDDGSFDRVVSNNALQFTARFDRALMEAFRVLRPGGELALVVYHRGSIYYWWWFFLVNGLLKGELRHTRSMERTIGRNIPWAPARSNLSARAMSRRGLADQIRAAGFSSVKTLVRGFAWAHLGPAGGHLGRLPGAEAARRALDTRVGWYVVARARRPAL